VPVSYILLSILWVCLVALFIYAVMKWMSPSPAPREQGDQQSTSESPSAATPNTPA
jgi:hypothetical protein